MGEPDNAYIDWKHWEGSAFGTFTIDEARYFAAETELESNPAPRVLEIGFGNGNFLGWAKSIGGEVFGVEPNPVLIARANSFFGTGCAFDSLQNVPMPRLKGYITHVVAFDVIEHIAWDKLCVTLTHIRELLAPDGRLIVRFPNGDSPFGRVTQHGDPTHVTTLGRQKLEYLARGAGLEVAEIRSPALPIMGRGLITALRRTLLKIARYMIERPISLLYFGGRRIPLDSNYVAILVARASGSCSPRKTSGI